MKIIQIAPVVEYVYDEYSNKSIANNTATIYGLGDDGKVYYQGKQQVKNAVYKNGELHQAAQYEPKWIETV